MRGGYRQHRYRRFTEPLGCASLASMTQYADILILALIALFVILRLRNTLGKDIGHKPDFSDLRKHLTGEADLLKPAAPQPDKAKPGAILKTPLEEEKEWLESLGDQALIAGVDAIRAVDPSFAVASFLEGAKGAFDWVLRAYKEGDAETLKNLLAPELCAEYEKALETLKTAEEKVETTLVSIVDAQLVAASLDKNRARATVRFLSDQIEITRNAAGAIIAGDASHTARVEDEWVFERDVKSRNPNWQIMDT